MSSASSSSPASSSSSLPATTATITTPKRRRLSPEDIEAMKNNNVRQSVYDPDFLKDAAERGVGVDEGFKLVTGEEAQKIYHGFLGDGASTSRKKSGVRSDLARPVVFAFTRPTDAGRKVVDFYMTWKGKTPKTHRLKGNSRKTEFLENEFPAKSEEKYDSAFDKATKTLDQEFKRLSRLESSPVIPQAAVVEETPAPPPPEPDAADTESLHPPRPSYLQHLPSNDSVVSLPFLTSFGNFPLGNRPQLRVLNPDPSMSSAPSSYRGSVQVEHHMVSSPLAQEDSASDTPSGDNASTSSKRHRHHKRSSEILIVLVDQKDKKEKKRKSKKEKVPTWHGLERRVSAKYPERTASIARQSPWNGPISQSTGEVHRYEHGEEDGDNGDDDDEDMSWGAAFAAAGYSPSKYGYSPTASNVNLASTASPYLAPPQSPYHSSAPNLPVPPTYAMQYPTQSPYVGSTPQLHSPPLSMNPPYPIVSSPYPSTVATLHLQSPYPSASVASLPQMYSSPYMTYGPAPTTTWAPQYNIPYAVPY